MKKLFYAAVALICLLSNGHVAAENVCETNSTADVINLVEMSAASIAIPTGNFFNGTDFIKVEKDWLRVVVNRNSKEYDFHAEKDPWGNYALTLIYHGTRTGEIITIDSGGRSLYYNGVKYIKK